MRRLYPTLSLVAILLLTTASSPAQPRLGSIRGRVEMKKVFQAPERRPSVSDLGTPPPREIPDLRRTVVQLDDALRRNELLVDRRGLIENLLVAGAASACVGEWTVAWTLHAASIRLDRDVGVQISPSERHPKPGDPPSR